jgi:hypothetical protein
MKRRELAAAACRLLQRLGGAVTFKSVRWGWWGSQKRTTNAARVV